MSTFSSSTGNGSEELSIPEICDKLKDCESKGNLGMAIADLVLEYSPRYLTKMKVNFSDKIDSLSPDYKRELEETIAAFLDGTFQKIRLMKQQGSFSTLHTPVSENVKEYWDMVARKCPGDDIVSRIRFLKYLLSGFCMFVQEIPGHPVGMPFPGGDRVDFIEGVYYCPVRTKAHDVDAALCPFCPAEQTQEIGYLKPPVNGSSHRKQEYIKNIYDYHHFNG
ncbi:MAG: DUF2115 domain-containing protein [Methanomicrobiales archaeon]|nr:DUF2115 domain-containing protein [Methanomicrobiales archaeon]